MKSKILRLLRENEGYVSGQTLCDRLGVSRTAIWKCMNQLKEDGYVIDAISNKGYCLLSVPDLITTSEIESLLQTKTFGKTIISLNTIDSTNQKAKEEAERKDSHGTLVIAEEQTAGKGRRGRTWNSPAGTGIWMSLILKPQMDPKYASMLTLVAGFAIVKAIHTVTKLDCKIKWPNDVVCQKKKVAGILTEMSTDLDCINHIVIGMGINANQTSFPSEISQMATSLCLESKHTIHRASLVAEILKELELCYATFLKTMDLSGLLQDYNSMLLNVNQQVRILQSEQTFTGIARGINPMGELLVDCVDGEQKTIMAGEVSVRGLYGYSE